jgi:hypothetical protein
MLVGWRTRVSVVWSASVLVGNGDVSVGFVTLVILSVLDGSTTWLAIAGVAVSKLGVFVADVFPQAKETKISATNTKKENRLLLLVLTTTLPF